MTTLTTIDDRLDVLFGLKTNDPRDAGLNAERIATLEARIEQLRRQHRVYCQERELILAKTLEERDARLKEQRTYLDRLEKEVAERTEEIRKKTERLERANDRMRRDLEAAARIQSALLPRQLPDTAGIRFSYRFQPCNELAGDSLNAFPLDDHRLGLYLLDVSGHGVPAALLSVTLSRFLTPQIEASSFVRRECQPPPGWEIVEPARVAAELNQRFMMDDDNQQYFTIIYGVLDLQDRRFRYISAGHPGIVHLAASEPPVIRTTPGFAIGWQEEATWTEHSIALGVGDRLYLYSDGITEAMKDGKEQFGDERLCAVVEEAKRLSLDESVESVLESAKRWSGGTYDDDASVLAIEVVGE